MLFINGKPIHLRANIKITGGGENYEQGYEDGYDSGYASGHREGYDEGKEESYDTGYNAGKLEEREEFWNAFTDNQNRNDYSYAFYNWNANVFYPTCNIGGTAMQRAFYNFQTCDLIARCEECGIKLDFSKCTSIVFCFAGSKVTTVPIIEITKASKLEAIFNNAYDLTVIEKIVLSESGTQTFSNCFNGCYALVEVRFEGVIGTDISFQHCPLLSKESLLNIFNALKNFSGTNTTQTITLHTDVKSNLTNAEKAIVTEKGWTLA